MESRGFKSGRGWVSHLTAGPSARCNKETLIYPAIAGGSMNSSAAYAAGSHPIH